MTIEYAKAYSNERIAHAQTRRRQRESVLGHRPTRNSTIHRVRAAVGNQLISIGERLSATSLPVPSTAERQA